MRERKGIGEGKDFSVMGSRHASSEIWPEDWEARYAMSTGERRSAALMRAVKSGLVRDLKVCAWDGVVDHTRVANGPGRGRTAIGPVGRKRWYAVLGAEAS